KSGETAADWARKYNHAGVLDTLKTTAAKATAVAFAKPLGAKEAAEKSTALLQQSAATFFVEGGCPACHSHNLTGMVLEAARRAGIKVDESKASTMAQETRAFWLPQEQRLPLRMDAPGGVDMVSYALFQFASEKVKPSLFTDAMVANTAATQQASG